MKLTERSYSTKILRPRPAVYAEPDGTLLVISTSWGSPEHAQRVNDDVAKYVQAAKADVEVTSPFEFLTSLTTEANYLRVAALIANEAFYRGDNKNEYLAGVETLILLRSGRQVAYAQVGSPHLLIQKTGMPLSPVAVNFEISLELNEAGETPLPPVPHALLGVDRSLNIRAGDFRIDDGDRLVLYAGSFWPESLWNIAANNDLQQITQKMVQKNPEAPFWLGLVDLQD